MKKNILTVAVSLLTVAVNAQNKADGNPAEWKRPLSNYDKDAHLQYSAAHNDSMFFICIRISEAKFQMKAAAAGMSVFIDTTGKKKQNVVINFPVKSNDQMPQKMERPTAAMFDVSEIRKRVEPALKQFNAKGFITGNGTYIKNNIEGITTVGAYDEIGILTIEYQVPFKTFYHNLTAEDKGKKITLSLVIHGLPMPDFSGTPPGDGPPGGGPPGGGGPPRDMPDPQEIEQMFQSSTTIFKYEIQ
jgi:hypothetical protein